MAKAKTPPPPRDPWANVPEHERRYWLEGPFA